MINQSQTSEGDDRLDWHAAFRDAIRLEFADAGDALSFDFEHYLSTEPLQIDAVIIKKRRGVVITKNIGRIFRGYNIIEYKSPDDYFSLADWYKVFSYVYLYLSLEKNAGIDDVTLSVIETRRPVKLLKYLRDRRFTVSGGDNGVYQVAGAEFPVQIIESKRLPAEENLWLLNLRNDIDAAGLKKVVSQVADKAARERARAYLDVLFRANKEIVREALRMKYPTFKQICEEAGMAKEWEDRGEARGRAEGEAYGEAQGAARVLDMMKQGYTADEIERMLAARSQATVPPVVR